MANDGREYRRKQEARFQELRELLQDCAKIGSACSLLEWDQAVLMPDAASSHRSDILGYLRKMQHEMKTGPAMKRLVNNPDLRWFSSSDELIGSVFDRNEEDFSKAQKLPATLVGEMAQVCAQAEKVWEEARPTNDFALLAPWLERIIKLKQQQAELIGFTGSPYDVLLDEFEPGMTVAKVEPVLAELRDFLIPLIKRLRGWGQLSSYKTVRGYTQKTHPEANHEIAEYLGFDFSRGRLDASKHPFSNRVHPGDTRMTTRYKDDDLLYSVMSTIHETGHSLYEQGMNPAWYGTCLGMYRSFGIHEGISRLYENIVGRDQRFWEGVSAVIGINGYDVVQSVQAVRPSLIRTEADEVTYNLHIIIRYELEKQLIEGELSVQDLPAAFNDRMEKYLGIKPSTDKNGVLQDVHWPSGYFGYFPAYALGNLYSAQLFQAAVRATPTIADLSKRENVLALRDWLGRQVFQHAGRYNAPELIQQATGQPISAQAWIDHIEQRYGQEPPPF